MRPFRGHRWPGTSVFVLGRRVVSSAYGALVGQDFLSLHAVVFGAVLVLGLGLSLSGSAPTFRHVGSALAANGDQDNDGILDGSDNCPTIANPDQSVDPCSPAGDWGAPLLYSKDSSSLWELDHEMFQDPFRGAPGDAPIQTTNLRGATPRVSPDGQHVAFNYNSSIYIYKTGVPAANNPPLVYPTGLPIDVRGWIDSDRIYIAESGSCVNQIMIYTLSMSTLSTLWTMGTCPATYTVNGASRRSRSPPRSTRNARIRGSVRSSV